MRLPGEAVLLAGRPKAKGKGPAASGASLTFTL